MKLKIAYFLIIILITIISTTSYSAYFYNDKQFSDILIANNKFVSDLVAVSESQIPPKLKPLLITKCNIDGKQICLVPFKVLLFEKDGIFRYIWGKSDSDTGEINGRWRVENSTLIFTLRQDYTSSYKKDSELRYKITKVLHSGTSLKYSCVSCPKVPGIIKTTNDPLKDFADIVVSMEQENVKNSLKK